MGDSLAMYNVCTCPKESDQLVGLQIVLLQRVFEFQELQYSAKEKYTTWCAGVHSYCIYNHEVRLFNLVVYKHHVMYIDSGIRACACDYNEII